MTIVLDALTTLARAKVFLGISSDTYDSLLTMLVNQATGFIKQYTKRDIKETAYSSQEHDGSGNNTLILKQFPVTALTTLQENNAGDNSDDWETIDAEDYFWYEDGRVVLNTGEFVKAPQRYRATYTAGYKIDFNSEADTTKHTLPFELEYACQKLVSALFNTRKAEGFSQSSVGDVTLSLKVSVMNDPEIRAILDKYTNPTI